MPAAPPFDDQYVGAAPPALPAEVRALSRLRPWRGVAQIALEWALIAAPIWACHRFFSWPLYLITVIWVGARQHALVILMHEAVHYRLWPDKRVNDALGDVTTAWPLFLEVASYREKHFAHHRHVNTPDDPDWISAQGLFEYRFPKRGWELGLIFVATLLGFGAYRQVQTLLFYRAPARPTRPRYAQLAFHVAVFTALALAGALPLYLAYWLVPLVTWTRWIIYLRFVAEHALDRQGDVVTVTRTVLPSLLGRLLVVPGNIHYHIEHHLYPSVPFYNLPALHRALMRDPAHRARAQVFPGFAPVLEACLAPRSDAANADPKEST
jgi:fatty acid desaturase